MLRPSPNHGTQRLPNDDDDVKIHIQFTVIVRIIEIFSKNMACSDQPHQDETGLLMSYQWEHHF